MSALQSHIERPGDTLYVCATSRLAQTLRTIPPSDDCRVWRTPRTLTLGQWFADLGNEALIAGLDDLPHPLDEVAVKVGQEVKAGEKLAVIEAMKMENILRADQDCKVKKISAAAGESLGSIRSSSSSNSLGLGRS